MMKSTTIAVSMLAVGAVLAGGGSAVADALITSKDIADNTVQSRDIRDNSIKVEDLRQDFYNTLSNDIARAQFAGENAGKLGNTYIVYGDKRYGKRGFADCDKPADFAVSGGILNGGSAITSSFPGRLDENGNQISNRLDGFIVETTEVLPDNAKVWALCVKDASVLQYIR